jgi:hypothetical protein
MIIKVIGGGGSKLYALEQSVRDVIRDNSIVAEVQKVRHAEEIRKFGIMSTPGLVINNRLVCTGTIPREEQILQWIQESE